MPIEVIIPAIFPYFEELLSMIKKSTPGLKSATKCAKAKVIKPDK
jgi:hypothetical protein